MAERGLLRPAMLALGALVALLVVTGARADGEAGLVIQEMRNESGELCCKDRFVCGLFDLEARRLLLPTPEWLAAVGIASKPA